METPRLRGKSELQILAYTTTTAMLDLSHICILCHSYGNAGSLTHWLSLGIEPILSQTLCCVLNPNWTTVGTPFAVDFKPSTILLFILPSCINHMHLLWAIRTHNSSPLGLSFIIFLMLWILRFLWLRLHLHPSSSAQRDISFFWLHPQHAEIPSPGIKPKAQQ